MTRGSDKCQRTLGGENRQGQICRRGVAPRWFPERSKTPSQPAQPAAPAAATLKSESGSVVWARREGRRRLPAHSLRSPNEMGARGSKSGCPELLSVVAGPKPGRAVQVPRATTSSPCPWDTALQKPRRILSQTFPTRGFSGAIVSDAPGFPSHPLKMKNNFLRRNVLLCK